MSDVTLDRPMPHDLDAERAVLGAILLDPTALHAATEALQPEDLHLEAHRLILAAMIELQAREAGIDMLTVRGELQRAGKSEAAGGPAYLADLTSGMPHGLNVRHYAALVKDSSVRRRIIGLAHDAICRGYEAEEPTPEIIEALQMDLLRLGRSAKGRGWRPVADLVSEAYEEIQAIAQHRTELTGIPTGFRDVDRLTQGLHRGEMIVVAGRPGHGKTSWVANVIANAILRRGTRVGLFTIEMSALEIVRRLLYAEAEIDSYRVSGGYLNREDWARLSQAAGELSKTHLWVDDVGGLTLAQLTASAQRLAVEHGLDLLAVDYLQLMSGSGRRSDNREREIADISRGLKCLAKDLNIPVIAISQLSRRVEESQRKPQLSDLRESGSIEQDADVVLFVWRDELRKRTPDNTGQAELIIGKQRNGPAGNTIGLTFIKQFCKFADVAPVEQERPEMWYER
jgi:replicative DNA helicase